MSEKKLLKDKLTSRDDLIHHFQVNQNKGFRTQILGFDDYGNQLFEEENQTVLGGALFTLLKVFNVKHKWSVDTLNSIMNVANDGAETSNADNFVCLFGVGTGGCGESTTSVRDVKVYEREIFNMIPFRVVDQDLGSEAEKYWFKKPLSNGYNGFYLKTFESIGTKVLWKDGLNGEDGSEVPKDVWNTNRTEPIETMVEIGLRIDRLDCREWFEYMGNIEEPRINSIGLFTGVKSPVTEGFEYKNVQLFSKLNMKNEILQMDKGMTLLYRIFVI